MTRSPRRRIAATLTSVLLAVMVLGVGSAAAIPPAASWGSTTPTDLTTGASPTMVSPGATVLLQSTWRNDSNSTISQLFLNATADGSIYNAGTVASPNYLITAKVGNNTVSTACVKAASLNCTFRNIKSGTTVHVEAVYVVPSPFAAGPDACPFGRSVGYGAVPDTTIYDPIDQPAACIHFEWSSVGAPSSDGGASHGDTWNWFDAVRVNSSSDFQGRYQLSGFAGFVQTNQLIGTDNPQATWASSRGATKIPLTVLDGTAAADEANCNSVLVDCDTGLWGEWSLVNVNDGDPITSTLYEFRILFDSSEIPQGVNASNIEIYHYWDGDEELISAACTFNPKKATTPNNASPDGCLVATNASGGDIAVTIWTTHNGGLRGSF